MKPVLQTLWTNYFGAKKVKATFGGVKQPGVLEEKAQVGAGNIWPIVDRSFPLDQAAEAHRYYESPERAGAVAIIVNTIEQTEGD